MAFRVAKMGGDALFKHFGGDRLEYPALLGSP